MAPYAIHYYYCTNLSRLLTEKQHDEESLRRVARVLVMNFELPLIEMERKLHMKSLGRTLPPMPPPNAAGRKKWKGGPGHRKDYSPLTWEDYFSTERDLEVDEDNIFHLYEGGSEGPVVFLIHGGGFSGLTWSVLSATLTKLVKCRTVAIDVRGHGKTRTTDEEDLSADRLARDIRDIVSAMYRDHDTASPIILVGHSMGGAIAIHSAVKNLVPTMVGMVIIDVVEGSALEALHSMQNFLQGRPKRFESVENAIEWVSRSGQIKNLESARVSMIGQLQRLEEDEMSESGLNERTPSPLRMENSIAEEDEDEMPSSSTSENHKRSTEDEGPSDQIECPYTWRIDLSKTEPYWKGWFQGMSSLFLSVPVPKMLLLAGVDRLDRDLAVGQMQGKFQMQVIGKCGHTMQEDQPHKVAEAIATFLLRHKMTEALSGFKRVFPSC